MAVAKPSPAVHEATHCQSAGGEARAAPCIVMDHQRATDAGKPAGCVWNGAAMGGKEGKLGLGSVQVWHQ